MTEQPDLLPPELLKRVLKAIKLCEVCEGEGHVADGLDEAACSIPCPPCFGTGYDAHAVAPMLIEYGRELEKAQGETLESMIAWGDQTFGPCTQQRAIERAGEEWDEMEQPDADVPVEAADVIICLLRIPGIREAINRKMAINRERTWSVRSDGTGYHVKNVEHRSKP